MVSIGFNSMNNGSGDFIAFTLFVGGVPVSIASPGNPRFNNSLTNIYPSITGVVPNNTSYYVLPSDASDYHKSYPSDSFINYQTLSFWSELR